MLVPAVNPERIVFPVLSIRHLHLQPWTHFAMEMSKALPEQPGVPETTTAVIIISWLKISYPSKDIQKALPLLI